jgi:sortase A
MTIVEEPTEQREPESVAATAPSRERASDGAPAVATEEDDERSPLEPVPLVIGWVLITIVGIAVALLAIGPISEERDQRALLSSYRVAIEEASNEAFGLAGIEVPTSAPAAGAPVAIVDIDRIGVSRVVVEGTEPQQTRMGPGHVVGTGGPGQPGNSVIVGRRALFGGTFAELDRLEVDDRILVTTSQGRTLYTVDHVGTHEVVAPDDEAETAPTTTSTTALAPIEPEATDDGDAGTETDAATAETSEPPVPDGPLTVDQLYGPSPDDRLTLVTTASGSPGAADEAVVVVARMEGQPFPPTPQGGRTLGDDGRSGSSGNWSSLILALLAYVVAVIGAIWLNRNVPWRSAYLLTAPVLVALTIVVADELVAALPAWS